MTRLMRVHDGIADQFIVTFEGIVKVEIQLINVVGLPMVTSGQIGRDFMGLAIKGDEHKIVITLFEHHRASITVQAKIIGHFIALVETPIVECPHNIDIFMGQWRLAFVKEIDTTIVGFGRIVKILIFHIDIFLAMNILIGSIGYPRS
jgi:hypothetical protein